MAQPPKDEHHKKEDEPETVTVTSGLDTALSMYVDDNQRVLLPAGGTVKITKAAWEKWKEINADSDLLKSGAIHAG